MPAVSRDTRPGGRIAATVSDPERSRLHGRLVAVGLALGVAGLGLLLAALLNVAGLVAVAAAGAGSGATILAVAVTSEVGYLAAGVGYLRGFGERLPLARPSGRELLAGVAAAVLLVVVGQAALRLVPGAGVEDLSSALGREGVDPAVLLAFAVVAVVLVGPAEELLFRGGVQGTLRLAFGRWPAIVGASALFTAVHAPALVGQRLLAGTAALAVVGVVSLVLGYAFERTGSLVVPVLVHSLYDGLLLGGAYLVVTGRLAL